MLCCVGSCGTLRQWLFLQNGVLCHSPTSRTFFENLCLGARAAAKFFLFGFVCITWYTRPLLMQASNRAPLLLRTQRWAIRARCGSSGCRHNSNAVGGAGRQWLRQRMRGVQAMNYPRTACTRRGTAVTIRSAFPIQFAADTEIRWQNAQPSSFAIR